MSNPRDRLLSLLFPERHGPRWSRVAYRLGDRFEDFALKRCGIDVCDDSTADNDTAFPWSVVEGVGLWLKELHRRRVQREW